jgi:hypothetical protein
MKKRIHSSLGYLTPDEYEKKWNEQKNKNSDIKEVSTSTSLKTRFKILYRLRRRQYRIYGLYI